MDIQSLVVGFIIGVLAYHTRIFFEKRARSRSEEDFRHIYRNRLLPAIQNYPNTKAEMGIETFRPGEELNDRREAMIGSEIGQALHAMNEHMRDLKRRRRGQDIWPLLDSLRATSLDRNFDVMDSWVFHERITDVGNVSVSGYPGQPY